MYIVIESIKPWLMKITITFDYIRVHEKFEQKISKCSLKGH